MVNLIQENWLTKNYSYILIFQLNNSLNTKLDKSHKEIYWQGTAKSDVWGSKQSIQGQNIIYVGEGV